MRDIKNINYNCYKKSSITFTEYIPSHWSVHRIKDVIHGIDQGWSPNAENRMVTENEWGVLKLSAINNGKYYENKHKALPSYEIPKHQYLVKRGDFLLTRSNTPILVGDCCLVAAEPTLKMMYSDLIYNLKINKRMSLDRYLNYLLSCESFRWLKTVSARGLNDSMVKISQGIIRGWPVCSPPASEQKNIADYLDNKTEQIDHQTDLLTQKLIQYGNLKQSLISETVTQGLDKNVTMKNSGIDWLGKVPERWKVKRVKDLFVESKKKSTTGDEALLSVSEYSGVTLKKDNIEEEEFLTRAETLIGYKICNIGELVINIMLAWKRGLGISSFDGIVSPSYAVYSPRKSVYSPYFHYLFRSERAIAEFKRNSTGIIESRLRLYTDSFFALEVAIPDYKEQKAIADFLDEKTAHIDRIVETINIQINKLKELRKTLINDVVTGKIKVTKEEVTV